MKRRDISGSLFLLWLAAACSSSTTTQNNVTVAYDAGASGGNSAGGDAATGGANGTGADSSTGGLVSGGAPSTGGSPSTGGIVSTGGTKATNNTQTTTGGQRATGGATATGGSPASGGLNATGGVTATGGIAATGGAMATGGSISQGGTVATGGSTPSCIAHPTCGTTPANPSLKIAAGYATVSTYWKGYAYNFAYPTTVTDPNCPMCPGDTSGPCYQALNTSPLCVSGTLGADISYASGTGLGINLNQSVDGSTAGTVLVSGTGLSISYSNCGSSALHLQLNTADGSKQWCVLLTGTGTALNVPWSSFTTNCWDSTMVQTPFSPAATQIGSIQLIVPSTASALPFNVCINDLAVY